MSGKNLTTSLPRSSFFWGGASECGLFKLQAVTIFRRLQLGTCRSDNNRLICVYRPILHNDGRAPVNRCRQDLGNDATVLSLFHWLLESSFQQHSIQVSHVKSTTMVPTRTTTTARYPGQLYVGHLADRLIPPLHFLAKKMETKKYFVSKCERVSFCVLKHTIEMFTSRHGLSPCLY